jgi:hypothetical protein
MEVNGGEKSVGAMANQSQGQGKRDRASSYKPQALKKTTTPGKQ